MRKGMMSVALTVVSALSLSAAIPLDGTVYDEYLKTAPGKERKLFLKEAFGGGQFDMRDLFEMIETTKDGDWDVRKAAMLDKLVRRGVRTLELPEALKDQVGSVVRLATGAVSPVVVRGGKRTFDLAADDRADELADAFELKN